VWILAYAERKVLTQGESMTAWQDANHEVEFAGVRMCGPLGVAAQAPLAPPLVSVDRTVELLLRQVAEGSGSVYAPHVIAELAHPPDRPHPLHRLLTGHFMESETKRFGREGMWCTAGSYRIAMRLDAGLGLVDRLEKSVPAAAGVVANIMGPGGDPDSWAALSHAEVRAHRPDLDSSWQRRHERRP